MKFAFENIRRYYVQQITARAYQHINSVNYPLMDFTLLNKNHKASNFLRRWEDQREFDPKYEINKYKRL